MSRLFLFMVFSLVIAWPVQIFAACSNNDDGNPGQSGDIEFFSGGAPQFCNGEEWIIITYGLTLTACAAGEDKNVIYEASDDTMRFCDASKSRYGYMNAPSVVRTDGCGGAAEGSLNYDTEALHYFVCNGTGWVPLGNANQATGYWKFDESAGTTAIDSFQTNDGTLVSGTPAADWVAGKLGNAVDFDGSTDYVDLGNLSYVNSAIALTVMMWFKIDDLNKDHDLFTKGAHGGSVPILIWRDDVSGATTNFIQALVYDGTDEVRVKSASGSVNDTNWHHVALTFDNNSATGLNLYLDGALVQTGDASLVSSIQTSANSVRIGGATPYNSSVAMDGQIDDVRIYSRVLTANEILAIYTATGGT